MSYRLSGWQRTHSRDRVKWFAYCGPFVLSVDEICEGEWKIIVQDEMDDGSGFTVVGSADGAKRNALARLKILLDEMTEHAQTLAK